MNYKVDLILTDEELKYLKKVSLGLRIGIPNYLVLLIKRDKKKFSLEEPENPMTIEG